jgi:hypothetical protein
MLTKQLCRKKKGSNVFAGRSKNEETETEGGGVVAQQVMRSEMGERRIFCWSVGAVPRALTML